MKHTDITADEIVTPMLDSHPELRPNAVLAENKVAPPTMPEPTPEPTKTPEIFKDKIGERFNPDKHYADKFGRPQYTEKGYFRKIPIKKRLKRQAMRALGREEPREQVPEKPEILKTSEQKPETTPEPASEEVQTPEQPIPEKPEIRSHIPEQGPPKVSESAADENRAAAKAVCSTIFTLGISVGGVQCKPLPQHVESMEGAWENYFRQKGTKDIPPGIAVVLSTGGYMLFCHQSSQHLQKQSSGLRSWIVRKIGNWKTKRAAAKVAKGGSD